MTDKHKLNWKSSRGEFGAVHDTKHADARVVCPNCTQNLGLRKIVSKGKCTQCGITITLHAEYGDHQMGIDKAERPSFDD